ncbi:MAG: ABC transporter ATP-binding protein [Clostridia bacterium]|nr:ABC transporter ATP-binding protein [Clostridia bacterium]
MRKLIPYLKGFYLQSILGPLFKLLEVCFELLVPLIMAAIIDTGIASADTGYILRLGGLLILMGVLGLASALTAQYFAAKAAFGFGTALRRDLFAHINRLSFSQLDEVGCAGLITRITGDINQAQSGVNLVLRLFLRSPFVVAGALIMAFSIHRGLALIFAAAVPLLALVIYLIMAWSMPVYKKVQKQLDKVSLSTRENLNGIRVIRAFSRQATEKKEFSLALALLKKFQLLAGKISALMNPLTYVLVNGAIILILWQGAGQVNAGGLTQGEVIALVNYMTQILLALIALAQLIVTFTRASASAARINEVFALSPDMTDDGNQPQAPVPGAPKVTMEQVSFAYCGTTEKTLDCISIKVQPGETVGIIGATGAGKSTLVNLIPRFYDVTEGRVLLDGVDVRRYPFAQLREKLGMVPQKAVLFQGTIRENMQWRKQNATDEEIHRALAIAQATEVVADKGGLDAKVAQGGKNFSGGQRQRLTIARALVGNPEILILDDSASALDFATDARLRKALAENTHNMTVFIVSQRVVSLKHADRILVLDDGVPAGWGSHTELFDTCPVYREICESQGAEKEVQQI